MKPFNAYVENGYFINGYQNSGYGRRDAAAVAPFGGHPTLTSGLLAHWSLEEASGNRLDHVAGAVLQDGQFGGPTSGVGRVGNCAHFASASSQYLECLTPNFFPADATRTVMFWAKPTSQNTYGAFDVDGNGNFSIYYDYGDWNFIGVNGTAFTGKNASDLPTWKCVFAAHDAVSNRLIFNVNTLGRATAATAAPNPAGSQLYVGRSPYASAYFNGPIDEIGIWDRVLTAQEESDYYNYGQGLAY